MRASGAARAIVRPSWILENVCWRCRATETRRTATAMTTTTITTAVTRPFSDSARSRMASSFLSSCPPSSIAPSAASSLASAPPRLRLGKPGSFFLSNSLLPRFSTSEATAARLPPSKPSDAQTPPPPPPSAAEHPNAHLPHRRRQALRRNGSSTSPSPSEPSTPLPPDASSILAHLASSQPAHSLRRRLSALLSLSKPRLTVLVVLSAMASYALYPVPSFLSPASLDAPSLSPLTLLFLTTGTTLCAASANALNMLYEPATDALMSRTRARPLVRGLISPRAAALFAVTAGAAGVAALWAGVNPTVAALGLANIVLYAGVYTPLKRLSWLNTWVGAVVGGIPPLMGWAAAAGESATGDGGWRELLFSFPPGSWPAALWSGGATTADEGGGGDAGPAAPTSSAGGWLLAGILFAWQFPHFMALSWGVRDEYRAAGLRMLCWVDPARNARVALRYGVLAFVPLCVGLCVAGVTEWTFALTSLPANAWLARESVRFWRLQGAGGSARGLFWASVWHLPVVMVLALAQKKGMWGRVWRSVVGEPEEEEDEFEDGEWEDEED